MSVTFFLKESDKEIEIPNPEFNPTLPEDFIYNSRTLREPIMPRVNLANSNAAFILKMLFPKDEFRQQLEQEWDSETIETVLRRIDWLLKDPPSHTINGPHYVRDVLKRLDKLCRYAIGLNDSILIC